jgi:hypothetical protein
VVDIHSAVSGYLYNALATPTQQHTVNMMRQLGLQLLLLLLLLAAVTAAAACFLPDQWLAAAAHLKPSACDERMSGFRRQC